VSCDRPCIEFCPVEWPRNENRPSCNGNRRLLLDRVFLVQSSTCWGWAACRRLHYAVGFVDPESTSARCRERHGCLRHALPADAVGVFRVESPAQLRPCPGCARTSSTTCGGGCADPPARSRAVGSPTPPAQARRAPTRRTRCSGGRLSGRCRAAVPGAASCRWRSTWPASTPFSLTSFAGRCSKRSSDRIAKLKTRLYEGDGGQRYLRRPRRSIDLCRQALRVRQLRLPGRPRDDLAYLLFSTPCSTLPPRGVLLRRLINSQRWASTRPSPSYDVPPGPTGCFAPAGPRTPRGRPQLEPPDPCRGTTPQARRAALAVGRGCAGDPARLSEVRTIIP